jgi:hypothetical protein
MPDNGTFGYLVILPLKPKPFTKKNALTLTGQKKEDLKNLNKSSLPNKYLKKPFNNKKTNQQKKYAYG